MMIIAMLLPALYSMLRISFRAKASADLATEPSRTAELAIDWIRADLSDALAPGPSTGTLVGPFTGTQGTDNRGNPADDLLFYTTADAPQDATNNGEIKLDELTVITTPNGSDHVLVRKITRDLVTQPSPNPDVEVLCRGVTGFSLRYYDGTQWDTTWDSTAEDNTLPAAVEVTVSLDRPNGNTINRDGSRSFKYVRVIPIACSTAAFDSAVNSGGAP